MRVFVLTFLAIAVSVLGMAVGVLMGRRPIGGSCGGLNREGGCELCRGGECRRPE